MTVSTKIPYVCVIADGAAVEPLIKDGITELQDISVLGKVFWHSVLFIGTNTWYGEVITHV